VVIQVSVFDDEDYEVDAINDIATRANPVEGDPPKLAVLIKERKANANARIQAGFDIYYLPAGTRFDDAIPAAVLPIGATNQAYHVVYNHGGPEVVLTITEKDLGGIDLGVWESIKNFLTGSGNNFEVSMSQLYYLMFVYGN